VYQNIGMKCYREVALMACVRYNIHQCEQIADRVEGAELLQDAELNGDPGSDEEESGSGEEMEVGTDGDDEEAVSGSEDGDGDGDDDDSEPGSDEDMEGGTGSEDLQDVDSDGDADVHDEEESEEEEALPRATKRARRVAATKPHLPPQPDSMAYLKKQLAAAKAARAAADGEGDLADDPAVPLEWGRMMTQDDFDRIRELKHRAMVNAAMSKHGLKSASKRAKALEAAEEEADETMALQERLGVVHQERVDPSSLIGKHKYRKDKEERLASVMEGREGREFGSKAKLGKKKSGGLSNREKDRRKNLPAGAHTMQVRRRKLKA
jgi:protein SDA1